MPNGRSQKNKGGILLTAVFSVFIMSILLLFLMDDMRILTDFSYRTRCVYEMKIMKELFLTDYLALPEENRAERGEVTYTSGTLNYQLEKDELKITALVNGYQRTFSEKLTNDTTSSESSTETGHSESTTASSQTITSQTLSTTIETHLSGNN